MKEFVIAVAKTMAVDALASGVTYLTGEMLEGLGLPPGTAKIMTAIVSGTVTYAAGKYFFKDELGNVVAEYTGEELDKILKGEIDDITPEIPAVKGNAVDEFLEDAADIADDIKRIDKIEVEFNYNSKYNEEEFARQLADQQKGMNELMVQEYLDNRQRYIDEGRALESNAAQQAAREKPLQIKLVSYRILDCR